MWYLNRGNGIDMNVQEAWEVSEHCIVCAECMGGKWTLLNMFQEAWEVSEHCKVCAECMGGKWTL